MGAGFVQNLAQPGGNITGSTILAPEMTPKRVELLKELIPNMSRVAFLWNSNNPSHLVNLDAWRAAAPKLGIEAQFVDVTSFDQFDPAFRAMMRERCDALSVTADAFHALHIDWIIDFVSKNELPTIYILRENAAAGGLISYGPSLADLFRRAATYSVWFSMESQTG